MKKIKEIAELLLIILIVILQIVSLAFTCSLGVVGFLVFVLWIKYPIIVASIFCTVMIILCFSKVRKIIKRAKDWWVEWITFTIYI